MGSRYHHTVTLISLILSIVSAIAAAAAVVYAKQNAVAAIRSARAGEHAAIEAQRSREVAETATVHSARQKTMEGAPNFYLALERSSPIAMMEESVFSDEVREVRVVALQEGTQVTKRNPIDLRTIYFDVYGVMQNRDSDPVCMVGVGGSVTLVEGESVLCDGAYGFPVRDARGRYILPPGQAVRFRWRVEAGLGRWLEIARGVAKDWGPINWLEMDIMVFHVIRIQKIDDPILKVTATAMHSPVYVANQESDVMIVAAPGDELDDIVVNADLFAHIPTSMEDLKPKR